MYRQKITNLAVFLMLALIPGLNLAQQSKHLPEGFVYVHDIIPDIKLDLRYYTLHNFIGERIDGYLQYRCILTQEAAVALAKVQEELKPFSLGLLIFDAYRPQQAVDQFVHWADNLLDTRMKAEFYPEVDKKNLFKEDYIAAKSSHSRGSTLDLTIVSSYPQGIGQVLDMGSGFDYFGPQSWPTFQDLPASQRAHRMLLQVLMKKHGFIPYPKEWWHFTLQNEPFPETYFNFPVQ